ncbi:MAG TPA: GlsB/YeaQ/YmgE family stress response membrane protein [Candidatus Saccharimonadales bacterium]|nr:GlsB/YeaQ/YmgE family stress response membrane protein [Candidatus Saccharimonadales bacterium]
MGILVFIIFGGLAGWLASMITGDNGRMGIITNIIVGVIGAFIGGFVANMLGGEGITGFNLYSFLLALGGAIVLLWFVGLFSHPKE